MENGPYSYCWLISQVTLNFHAKTTDDSSSISMAFVAETDSLYAFDIICLTNRQKRNTVQAKLLENQITFVGKYHEKPKE